MHTKSPNRRRQERRHTTLEPLEDRIAPAQILVFNSNDQGPGSLRQAILDANSPSNPGPDTISFANIGPGGPFIIQLQSVLPAITETLTIDGYTAPGTQMNTANVGSNAVLRVMLDGSKVDFANGLVLEAGSNGSVISGLAIAGFHPGINESGYGILIHANNVKVSGNFIGTTLDGSTTYTGVDNGGSVLKGNGNAGVGVDVFSGSASLTGNVIGGTAPRDRNVISGNTLGVYLGPDSQGTLVQGNLIGTDKTGNAAVPNASSGVTIVGSSSIIGGTVFGAGNVISGNGGRGIIAGTGGNTTIQGNIIGLNAGGTAALGNGNAGIELQYETTNVTIGGTTASAGNVIAANARDGIAIGSPVGDGGAHNVTVIGNKIGTDASGTLKVGNVGSGIAVYGTTGAIIGGVAAGESNMIGYNGGSGVVLADGGLPLTGVRISGNAIFNNAGLGIDLRGGAETAFGVTKNDVGDADTGPNHLTNSPLLTSFNNVSNNVTLGGTLVGKPSTQYVIEFFAMAPSQVNPSGSGDAGLFLGTQTVTTGSTGTATLSFNQAASLPTDSFFSATATEVTTNETSEFSNAIGPSRTFTWTGSAGNGDWFTPNNWAPNTGFPTANDTAVFNGGPDIVLTGATASAKNFQHLNGNIIGTGQIAVLQSFTWAGGTQTGPDLLLDVGSTSTIGSGAGIVTWDGGALNNFGSLTITGNGLNFNSGGFGNLNTGATLTLNAGLRDANGAAGASSDFVNFGTLDKAGAGNFGVQQFSTAMNNGLIKASAGTLVIDNLALEDGELRLAGGNFGGNGTLTLDGGLVTGTGTISQDVNNINATISPGGTGVAGTITITGAYTHTSDATLLAELGGTNPGQFDVLITGAGTTLDGNLDIQLINGFTPGSSGQFRILQSPGNPGTFAQLRGSSFGFIQQADATGLQIVRSTQTYVWDNTVGDGDWFNPLNWNLDLGVPGVNDTAVLNINSTINLSGDTSVGVFQQSAGIFTSAANVTFTAVSSFVWSGGTQTGDGETDVALGGTFTLAGAAGKTLDLRALVLEGDSTVTGDGTLNLLNGPDIINHGVFDVQTDADFLGAGTFIVESPGTFKKSNGAGSTQFGAGVGFNNLNAIAVATGTLELLGGGQNLVDGGDTAWTVSPGATLLFGGGIHGYKDNTVFDGGGTIRIAGGTLNIDPVGAATLRDAGTTLSVEGGTLTVAGSFTADAATILAQSSGMIDGGGTLNIKGQFNWTGGTITGGGDFKIATGATASLTGSLDKHLTTVTFSNAGTIDWLGIGQIVVDGATIKNSGAINVKSDATMAVGAASTFDNLAGGIVEKNGGINTSTFSIGITFNNAGTVRVTTGKIDLGSAYTQTAGVTELVGGNLQSPGTLVFNGGELRGTGVIGASVSNSGATVRPGGTLAAGTITIVNNYAQNPGGTLAVEIGGLTPGSQFDVLDVDGTTALAGTLDIANINSFVPAAGNQFRVVQAQNNPNPFGSLTGAVGSFSQLPDATGLVLAVAGPTIETDVSLSGGNLVVTDINGGTTDDTLTITLVGTKVRVSDPSHLVGAGAGATQIDPNTVEVPLTAVTGNIQVNTLGGNDTLTLALAGGDFIVPGGLTYAAGAPGPGSDVLIISGGAQGTVTYGFTNTNDGSVDMSAIGLVSFTGLEHTTNTGAATDILFNLPAGPNALTLGDDGTSGNTLSSLSGSTILPTDFANPASLLTISSVNTNDTLTVNALPDFNASLTIGSPVGPLASLNFAGAVTLGVNKTLSAFASGTISFSSSFATSGTGRITLSAGDLVLGGGAGSISGTDEVFLTPATDTATTGIGAGATGTFNLDPTDLAALANGFLGITIGRGTPGAGAVDIKASTFQDTVTILGGTIVVTGLNAGTNGVSLITTNGPIQNGGDVLTDVVGGAVVLTKGGAPFTADFFSIGGNAGGTSSALSVDATTVSVTADAGSIAVEAVGTGGVSMSLLHTNNFDTGNIFASSSTEDVAITSAQIIGNGFMSFQTTGHNLSVNNLTSGPGMFAGDFTLATVASGNVTVGSATPAGSTVNVTSAGNIVVNGPINGSTSATWSAGGSVTGAGDVTLTGTSNFNVTANGAINLTGVITVPGTTTLGAGAANDITLTNVGNSFATVSVLSGATVSLRDDVGFDLGAINTSTLLAVRSTGGITQSAPITGTGGLTKLGLGTLTLSSANTYTGATLISGGTLILTGSLADGSADPDVTMSVGTILAGTGTIGGSLSNSGTVQPGGSGTVGKLTISGGYTQSSGGTLAVDLGGTSPGLFDVLSVGQNATLDGALNVATLPGFTVAAGDQFRVVSSANNPGMFASLTGGYMQTADGSGLVVELTVIPPSQISIGNAAIVEGNTGVKQLVFKLTLDTAPSGPVSVSYDTADFSMDARSAASGIDYKSVSGGVATFGPGQLSTTIAIDLVGDTVAEPTERFKVVLSNPSNAIIATGEGIGSILDDDHHTFAVSQGNGNSLSVFTTTATGATETHTITDIFAPNYRGGVRVAVGDVTGDGVDDIIAGAGLGGRAKVRVFDGVTFEPVAGVLGDLSAFSTSYRGGVFVAAGDVDGDGRADVVVTPSAGSTNQVRIFSGADGSLLNSFRAFGKGAGGVRVAVGDVNGDGFADVIAGTGIGSSVRIFDAMTGSILAGAGHEFRAFSKGYRGGVYVAAGDVNGDGIDDVLVGAAAGSTSVRSYLMGVGPVAPKTFAGYDSKLARGVRLTALDVNGDGIADIITSKGRRGDNTITVLDGVTNRTVFDTNPFAPQIDGLYVG